MIKESESWRRRLAGTIEQIEVPDDHFVQSDSAAITLKRTLYRWRPPYQLAVNLPPWYDLTLLCSISPDGFRRFAPAGLELTRRYPDSNGFRFVSRTEGLLHVASLGGAAILSDRNEVDEGALFTANEARLFCQYVCHMQEHLGNTNKLGRVLKVCAGVHTDRGTRHILPPDLGLDAEGEGDPWDTAKLRMEGLKSAIDAGISHPTPDQILRYGLMSAAEQTRFHVSCGESKQLVRMTLFDLPPSTGKIDGDDLEYVARQVRNSLSNHLNEPTHEFDKWIEDPKSNLVHRISKRKDCPLDRQGVRNALLELGWQAMQAVGQCVDKQMQVFRDAISEPLSEQEAAMFAQIYLAHPFFGDLPLLLLHHRFEFLRETIPQLWAKPSDQRSIGIVHTMMNYYATLVSNRRRADRRWKRTASAKNRSGRTPRQEDFDDSFVRSEHSSFEQELIAEAARHVARARGDDCDFGNAEWEARIVESDEMNVVFVIYCERFEFERTYRVTLREFKIAVESCKH